MRRRFLTVVVAALAAALPAAAHQDTVAPDCGAPPPMSPLTFDEPRVVDPGRAGGEPVVVGLEDGTLLVAGNSSATLFDRQRMPDPDFVTPVTGGTYLWRSSDGGDTWAYVGLAGAPVGPHATVTGVSAPDLAVGPDGAVYTASTNLANVSVARSADAGRTWTGHPLAATMVDREWLATDEADVVYLVGSQRQPEGRRLWKSTDGGLTFSLLADLPGAGAPTKPAVDPTDGRLYLPVGDGSVLVLPDARSDDAGGFLVAVPGGTPRVSGFFNPVALDNAGNVYVVSNTATDVRLSVSTDRGRSWDTHVVHDAAPLRVLWPWVSAGADGRVAVTWLQADRPLTSVDAAPAKYRVHAAQTVTGHGWVDECGIEHPPVWDVVVATAEPIHQGTICTGGTPCQIDGVDRRLGNYHTNTITPQGRLVIAVAMTTSQPDSAVARAAVIRQSAEEPDAPKSGRVSSTSRSMPASRSARP